VKKGDALSPLLSNFALKHAIRTVKENQEGLVYDDNINTLGGIWNTIKKKTQILLEANSKAGLETNTRRPSTLLRLVNKMQDKSQFTDC